jgi:tetratricopeptide (TPR) repeat protein
LRSKLGLPGISVSQSSELRAAVPSTPEAARFYYQGLEQLRTFDLLKSRESFTQALKLDPNFSLAHAYLAEAWEGLGYDEKARQESKLAFDLSSHLGREDKTLIEARYRAISGDWDQAVNLYRSLYTLYPENPEYAYRATDVQIRAGKADDAIKTIDALRKEPQPIAGDPRLDLKEAEAAESLSDFAKENQLAAKAAASTGG